jgi:DNA primase
MIKIKNFPDVVNQVRSKIRDYLESKGIDTSKNFTCIHPKHEDHNPSMTLIPNSDVCYCFGCNRVLSIFQVCSILDGKPWKGKEWITDNLKYLADMYGIAIETTELTEDDIYEIDQYQAYKAAADFLIHKFNGADIQQVVKGEVLRRQWTTETLEKYDIGTIFDYDDYKHKLKEQGYSISFLTDIQLIDKEIFNPNCLIFTWHDEYGRPVGFTGRNVLFEQQKIDNPNNKNNKKYKNIATTQPKYSIFKKNSRLFGIFDAKDTDNPLWIFEGQADVITAKQAGLTNSCCIGGSLLSEDQIHLAKKLGHYNIIICMDGDNPGREKIDKILATRLKGHRDISVSIVLLPEGEAYVFSQ